MSHPALQAADAAFAAALAESPRGPDRDGAPLYPLDLPGEPSSEVVTTGRDAHEGHAGGALVALEDLVRDAG